MTDAALRVMKYMQVDNYTRIRGIIAQYTFLDFGKVISYDKSKNTISVLVKNKITINGIEVISLGGNGTAFQIIPAVDDIVLLFTTKEVIDSIHSFTIKNAAEYDLSSIKAIPVVSAADVKTVIVCDDSGININSESYPINITIGKDSNKTTLSCTDKELSATVKSDNGSSVIDMTDSGTKLTVGSDSSNTLLDMKKDEADIGLSSGNKIKITSSGVDINGGHLSIS